jgi:hypothetical protein
VGPERGERLSLKGRQAVVKGARFAPPNILLNFMEHRMCPEVCSTLTRRWRVTKADQGPAHFATNRTAGAGPGLVSSAEVYLAFIETGTTILTSGPRAGICRSVFGILNPST